MLSVVQTKEWNFRLLWLYFFFLKWWGQVPILRSIQYVTFKYDDFQKASRISLREPSMSISSIVITYNSYLWSCSLARTYTRQFDFLLGNSTVLLGNLNLQTIIWARKTVKPENVNTFFPWQKFDKICDPWKAGWW